ncbi:uncharacterized protein Z519_09721 [Cladophialophora bantiana CBS 173.52]|uniref:Fe2OG dioxygenase domain-containing protein n=1 Tax=Cladophialophora bantiana (strain ATCC 10958 / CBS 173.52 / CDC B-1940 / NIH 8579) TaxID=1442370 RepID=A0A0D2HFM9_CLAB1|nr:uncharacterized protein Z519_09721 [Cladophialophora bantiana CBS 173.52]KIW89565.1 hypothetical protein Z519_09721 [Cladophialophora bantiana CBS 173.52]
MLFEPGSVPPGPPIETKKALILLDFQNDFVKPNGNLPVANVEPFLSDLLCLVDEFRAKGEVIWIGTEYRQSRSAISSVTGSHSILLKQHIQRQDLTEESSEYYNDPGHTRSPREDPLSPSPNPDVTHDREAFLAPLLTTTKYRCCKPGSSGADYPKCIKEAIDPKRDLVMLKSHYSAFDGTSLLMHLRSHLITEVYICGTLSNIGVYATVLDAVCHGVQVTLVEDCLGYIDETCHIEAMRQMADTLGANGIDCQELRDDIAGLLGDVIHEEDYPTRFQVSLPPPARTTRSHTSRSHIHDWISGLEAEEAPTASPAKAEGTPSKEMDQSGTSWRDSNTPSESSRRSMRHTSVERSPPRKRSTSDLDPLDEERALKLSQKPSSRRTSTHAEQLKTKQTQQSTRKRRPSHESSTISSTPTTSALHQTLSTGKPSTHKEMSETDQPAAENLPLEAKPGNNLAAAPKKKTTTPNILGPGDKLGQEDCKLYTDLLDQTEAEHAFYSCRSDIKWQKMYHRSGEVPRLVAVQGSVSKDGMEVPIYRHPADESPALLPFDAVVNMLRRAAEKVVGHPLNHALIQWYRHGEDNISEHSDKTLDIVRGSQIVNVSLGAQRTMILRAKKSATTSNEGNRERDAVRPSQRIPLPHNSLFVLGQETNRQWLHSIRADKRPVSEKTPAELAFDGERISFTFRHIGTFINLADNTIWGQGATSKQRRDAKPLLTGAEAEKEGEAMIRAFGQENHRSADWDWNEWYGRGFDVVNFETKPADEVDTGTEEIGSKIKGEKRKIVDDGETPPRAGSAPF